MNTTLKTFRAAGTLTLIAALAACGGGGGGSTPTAPAAPGTPVAPTVVVVDSGTLHTSVSASTYGAGTLGDSAFTALNAARQGAGAGLVSQNIKIDVAAGAHAAYVQANGVTHIEDSGKPGFYAASVSDRLIKAGFNSGFNTETIGGTGASLQGRDCVLGLLNTVYHGVALLSIATDVGFGFGLDAAGTPLCVTNPATVAGDSLGQVPAAGAFIAYPYSGQQNVFETFYAGYETPRVPVSDFPNLTAGTPIIVSVRNADYLNFQAAGTLVATVTAFNLKDAGGNLVPAGILALSGLNAGPGVTLIPDSNMREGFVSLVPFSPLVKGQSYTATFSATLKSGGPTMTKTWSFTTNP